LQKNSKISFVTLEIRYRPMWGRQKVHKKQLTILYLCGVSK